MAVTAPRLQGRGDAQNPAYRLASLFPDRAAPRGPVASTACDPQKNTTHEP